MEGGGGGRRGTDDWFILKDDGRKILSLALSLQVSAALPPVECIIQLGLERHLICAELCLGKKRGPSETVMGPGVCLTVSQVGLTLL